MQDSKAGLRSLEAEGSVCVLSWQGKSDDPEELYVLRVA